MVRSLGHAFAAEALTIRTRRLRNVSISGMEPIIEVDELNIAPTAIIGDASVIRARQLTLDPYARIGVGAMLEADQISLGHRAVISDDCTLRGVGGPAVRIAVGDQFFLGPSSAILVPHFLAGDYVAIHNHLLCNGYEPCIVGHNTWIGQNCVLNSTDTLTIGNNVGIGAYSSIYTHAYNGELLEGCATWHKAPVVVEDNAWLVGGYNVISPGVTVGSRSMVLTSSVVSRDVPPGHAVGGVPARDLTDRITPFRDVTVGEKLDMMRRFVQEFVDERHPDCSSEIPGGFLVTPPDAASFFVVVQEHLDQTQECTTPGAVYTGDADLYAADERTTIFNVSTKQYTKRRTPWEIALIGFMNGYRARFVPSDNPRITATPASAGRPAK
jgi:acetyltransferase-like isoleucine patch superfamily enzyme